MLDFWKMHPAIPRLIELQSIDHHIAAVRSELDTFPGRVVEAGAKLNGARAALASAKEAHSAKLKERKKFELDAQQWKERAAKYRDQSGAVKTNEAFRALQQEIASAESEVARTEDAQLEAMMAIEEAESRVRHAEADLKEFEKLVAGDLQKIQALNSEKKKEMNAALAEREKAAATVPGDLRELYDRIARRHHGTAMARVRDEQCGGCGMRILPHIIQELRLESSEEIFRCETCGLILYTLDPIAAPDSARDSGDSASVAANS